MTVDCYIKNKTNGYKFVFRVYAPLMNDISQPVIPVSIINAQANNNILFRFMGQQETFVFNFAVYNDGSAVDQSTYTSPVITIPDQIDYLKYEVFKAAYDTDFEFYESRFARTPIDCVITKISFDNPPGGASLLTGSFSITRGRLGSF